MVVEPELFVRCSDLGPLVAHVPVGAGAFQRFCQASLIFPRLPLSAISCFKSKWEKSVAAGGNPSCTGVTR